MIPSISQWPTKKKYRVVFHCLDSVKSTGLNQGEGGPCHAQARETIIWISLAAALAADCESCASFEHGMTEVYNDPYEI